MQVQVLMRVDVIQGETSRGERLELGADLGGEMTPDAGGKKIAKTGGELTVGKAAVAIDEAAELSRRQDGVTVDQHEMQPDFEAWQAAAPEPRHRPRQALRPSGWRSRGCRRDARSRPLR